jgi:hypothetical protein
MSYFIEPISNYMRGFKVCESISVKAGGNSKGVAPKPAGGVREEEQVGFNIVSVRKDEGHKVYSSGIQQRGQ